ncbi:DUF952 domain-containing protein [Quadrisphaera sp. INWT6]|uniref:DUF952 domain-containing protein n=1 Tax=Quadrisphaera sp. INWT6 TaxID=2596917 RepID=UPI001892722B|nr:DUF952 domain-containing protein [Quadrisphaera sp. INWT6]MBF5083643.1 DUF952 domain-containing protein [Quadrisphaera sp. INWT6]
MRSQSRVTLADVAAAAGVSPMTASYAYSQPGRVAAATRQRVLDAAAQLGYLGPDPSGRFLRQGSLRSLGLVLGEDLAHVFDDPTSTAFVAGLARVCASQGYGLTLLPTTGGADDAGLVAAAAVDAFVVWSTTDDDPVLDAVCATHRRAVLHGAPPTGEPGDGAGGADGTGGAEGLRGVGIDERAAARALATATWRGRAAPAVLSSPLDRARRTGVHRGLDPDRVALPVTRARLDGFRDAALDLGLTWDDVAVAVCGTHDEQQALRATRVLVAAGADALVAMSGRQALAAHHALGLTGGEVLGAVALGGFDDSADAARAGLTSVEQSLEEQGARAARLALALPDPGGLDAWRLVERASTAAPSSRPATGPTTAAGPTRPVRVLHLAERSAWERARAEGGYRGSTRGADLAEVGFVHACTAAQLPGVLERYYADLPLDGHELLVVDVAACEAAGSAVRWEAPPGGGELFPHVHGPLPLSAVVAQLPLRRDPRGAAALPTTSDLEALGVPHAPPNG